MKKEFLLRMMRAAFICLLSVFLVLSCIGCKKTVTYEEYISVEPENTVKDNDGTDEENTPTQGDTADNKDNSSSTGTSATVNKEDKSLTKGKTFTICAPNLPTSVDSDSPLFEKVLFD